MLRPARQQRCLLRLWRNLLPDIHAYAARAGKVAGLLVRFTLKAMFAASNLEEARLCLENVERTLGHIPDLAGVLRTVRHALPNCGVRSKRNCVSLNAPTMWPNVPSGD